MSSKPIAHVLRRMHMHTLQQQLDSANDGDTVTLKAGEYMGPLIVRRAVTLRGMDGQTVVWHPTLPPIIVLADDVRLANLHVETTMAETTIYYAGQPPRLTSLTPQNPQSIAMQPNQLIQLNNIDQTSGFFLPIPVEQGILSWEMRPKLLKVRELDTSIYTDWGYRAVTLAVTSKPNFPAGQLVAMLSVADKGGRGAPVAIQGSTTGHPVEAVAKVYLVRRRDGRRIYAGHMLRLDDARAPYIRGKANRAGQTAGVISMSPVESGSHLWATHAGQLQLNGSDVPLFTRTEIKGGDVIMWGGETFDVDRITGETDTEVFIVDDVVEGEGVSTSNGDHEVEFQLKSDVALDDVVGIESLVSWLTIHTKSVTLKDDVTTIRATIDGTQLKPSTTHMEPCAIAVSYGDVTYFATLQVKTRTAEQPAQPPPHAAPAPTQQEQVTQPAATSPQPEVEADLFSGGPVATPSSRERGAESADDLFSGGPVATPSSRRPPSEPMADDLFSGGPVATPSSRRPPSEPMNDDLFSEGPSLRPHSEPPQSPTSFVLEETHEISGAMLRIVTPFLWFEDVGREVNLVLDNLGDADWKGTVIGYDDVNGVSLTTKAISIPAGKRFSMTVMLLFRPSHHRLPKAITIEETATGKRYNIVVGLR